MGSMGGEDKAISTEDRNSGTLGVTGGRSLITSLRRKDINSWLPTVVFPFGACHDEIAATYTLRVEGVQPFFSRDWRNSRMVVTMQETGSSPLPAHQNLLHLHPYCRRVDGVCALAMVSLTKSMHSIKSWSVLKSEV